MSRPEIVVREPRDGDVDAIVANLRPADRDECEALLGPGRERSAIEDGLKHSTMVWVATADGVPGCVFGVVPMSMLGGDGVPWLLGTPLIDRHRGAFMRRSRAYIARMLAAYPSLANIVDARNVRAIGWLKRMGFTVHETPMPAGPLGLPFHLFTMKG